MSLGAVRGSLESLSDLDRDSDSGSLDSIEEFRWAVYEGSSDYLQRILDDANIDVNQPIFEKGQTALHIAAAEGDLATLRILIENGAHLDVTDEEGSMPIDLAIESKQYHILSELKMRGCSLDMPYKGRSHLTRAARRDNIRMVQSLIDLGANKTVRDADGSTAFVFARSFGFKECAEVLGSDPYSEELLDRTLLAHAHYLEGVTYLDGNKISLEGAESVYMHECLLKSLEAFFNEERVGAFSQEEKETLLEAFRECSSFSRNYREVAAKIQNGEAVIYSVRSSDCNVNLVFFGSYMAICNTADGPTRDTRTIKVFKIDSSKVDHLVIRQFEAFEDSEFKYLVDFLYGELPTSLGAGTDQISRRVEKISPPAPKAGVSGYAIGVIGLRALSALIRLQEVTHIGHGSRTLKGIKQNSQGDFRSIQVIKKEAVVFSLFSRMFFLEGYFKKHRLGECFQRSFCKEVDYELVARCWKRLRSSIKQESNLDPACVRLNARLRRAIKRFAITSK